MIECEFSAVARQCLNRRIPTIKQLEKEVLAIIKERNEKKIKIVILNRVGQKQIESSLSERFCWQFKISDNLVSELARALAANSLPPLPWNPYWQFEPLRGR